MKQFRYLQLNKTLDMVIGESFLLGEVDHPEMILDNEVTGNIGDVYDKNTGKFKTVKPTVYDIDMKSLKQDSLELTPVKDHVYYVEIGEVQVEADCNFKGNMDTSLSLPLSKTPVVRFSNNSVTNDEVYGSIEIVNGVLTGKVNLPRSGDWRFQADRINNALKTFGISWEVAFEDIHLIV